jgi:TetR/AcrR family transcriptional regulator, lmrAB and yxaGH operons repressor
MPPKPDQQPQPGTRDQILESAIFLMRQSGLSGAGINQILEHSKAPKGSMYYYFPKGKLQITREALERYGARVAAAMETALASKNKPAEKVRALFRSIAQRLEQSNFDQSCAVGAVALDLNTDVEELRPVVAEIMATWRRAIASHFKMRTRVKGESFAGLVLSAIEGGYVRGRAERSSAPLLEAAEWIAHLADAAAERAR